MCGPAGKALLTHSLRRECPRCSDNSGRSDTGLWVPSDSSNCHPRGGTRGEAGLPAPAPRGPGLTPLCDPSAQMLWARGASSGLLSTPANSHSTAGPGPLQADLPLGCRKQSRQSLSTPRRGQHPCRGGHRLTDVHHLQGGHLPGKGNLGRWCEEMRPGRESQASPSRSGVTEEPTEGTHLTTTMCHYI